MGNQAAKINRKIDQMLAKAYNYFWTEENISEISLDNTSEIDQQDGIQKLSDENLKNLNSKNDNEQQYSQQDEEENNNSQILESIISLSITKEDFNQDKRKAQIFLDTNIDQKKICINKENYIVD